MKRSPGSEHHRCDVVVTSVSRSYQRVLLVVLTHIVFASSSFPHKTKIPHNKAVSCNTSDSYPATHPNYKGITFSPNVVFVSSTFLFHALR